MHDQLKFAIYYRTDVCWLSMSEENFLSQASCQPSVLQMPHDLRVLLLKRIRMWNGLFGMSYFEYRHALREISTLNHSHIRGIDCIIRNRHHALKMLSDPHFVVVPCDDDDWFAPDLTESLRTIFASDTDFAIWKDVRFSFKGAGNIPSFTPDVRWSHCGHAWTNSYAVCSQVLQKCPEEIQSRVLNEHGEAARLLKKFNPKLSCQRSSQVLAATCKTPASITRMRLVDSPDKLLRLVAEMHTQAQDLHDSYRWVAPYIAQVRQLNEELVNSCRNDGDGWKAELNLNPKGQLLNFRRCRSHGDVIRMILRYCQYNSYLEIGCASNATFRSIPIADKVGVDPQKGGTLRMTSDEFFSRNQRRFDLVFIDGLHLCEQVLRDIEHSLDVLNEGGTVLVHDCLPQHERHQLRRRLQACWTGDVWKAVVKLRERPDIDIAVLNRFWGIAAIRKRPNQNQLHNIPELTWDQFRNDKARLLNLVDFDSYREFLQR